MRPVDGREDTQLIEGGQESQWSCSQGHTDTDDKSDKAKRGTGVLKVMAKGAERLAKRVFPRRGAVDIGRPRKQ